MDISFEVEGSTFSSIVSLAACASKDKMTPIINAVGLSVEDEGRLLKAVATDRYVAVRATYLLSVPLAVPSGVLGEPIAVSTVFLVNTLRALKSNKTDRYQLQIGVTDETVTVTDVNGAKFMDALVSGNFPPIDKLFPPLADTTTNEQFAEIELYSLDLQHLVKFSKVSHPRSAATPVQFQHLKGSGNPDKPGAIFLSWGCSEGSLEGLVQPAVLRK